MAKNIYSRNGVYWARFTVCGQAYRRSLSTRSKQEAERRLRAVRARIEDELHFGKKAPTSWERAVVEWHAYALKHASHRTTNRYIVSLNQMASHLEDKMIHQINDEVLRVIVRARRASGATTRTIKNDLTALSSVLGYAQEEGWIEINPTLSFRTRRSLRDKFVPIKLPQKASIDMMLAASPSRFGDAQEFARETGMREEEIFGLKHTSIDLGRGNVTIFGKRDHVRVIVLTQRARSIVARQPRNIRSPYVFWHSDGQRWVSPGSRFGDIRRRVAQKAAQSKIEFEPFCFHHLRHLFAVEYLLNERGSVYALQKILGHNSIKTTERYLAHVTHDVDSRTKHGVT